MAHRRRNRSSDSGHSSGGIFLVRILFYPGAKVEAEAYLPLLDQIRQTGVTCILVHMPFHMAIFDANAAEDVMAQFPEIQHWYIAGHSMGGAMASKFASVFFAF